MGDGTRTDGAGHTVTEGPPWDARFESMLRSVLRELLTGDALAPDVLLPDLGMDSTRMAELMVAVEDEYDLALPDELLVPDTFSTPSALWRTVASLRSQDPDRGPGPTGGGEGNGAGEGPRRTAAAPSPYDGSGVPVYGDGDGQVLREIVAGIVSLTEHEAPQHITAPPVIPMEVVDRSGYSELFPQLLGTVATAADRQGAGPPPGSLALTSAACHHVYPRLADGTLSGTARYTVEAYCFRAESTVEPGRMRSFRMREFVLLGEPEECRAMQEALLERTRALFAGWGVATEVESASDPFFGRPGLLRANNQKQEQLKWELTAEVAEGRRQAVASFNHHQKHFGTAFGISGPGGDACDSMCAAFGLDRLLLAVEYARRSR